VSDEEAARTYGSFPIAPADLIERAQQWLLKDAGLKDPSMFADDFEFSGPFVGPLTQSEYVAAAETFALGEAFPDLNPRFCMFHCDPLEPGRVWFFSRGRGTFTGPLRGREPNNKGFELPPEAISLTFRPDGTVRRFTVGAVVDRTQGNTGGLGGVFGILYAVGRPLPFREARPWRKSLAYRIFELKALLKRRLSRLLFSRSTQ